MLCAKKFGRSAGELRKGVGDGASTAEVVNREPVERLRFADIVSLVDGRDWQWRVAEWDRLSLFASAKVETPRNACLPRLRHSLSHEATQLVLSLIDVLMAF